MLRKAEVLSLSRPSDLISGQAPKTGPSALAIRAQQILAALLLLTVAACSSQKPQPEQASAPTAQPQSAAALQRWEAIGKLGVRSPKENGSANLTWQQASGNYRIHLSGPLGAGATVISGSPGGVSLQRGSDPAVFASNPAQLTEQVMGWPLPVSEMFYWVRGLAAPGAVGGQQKNAKGQLQSLQQSGWQLNFGGYQTVGPYQLPTRIKAATNNAAGPVSVTVVIKEWSPR
ncbi:lipoprotein insertase outer membrane protein LolB [Microbulbifer hydrolyticus]|uniref:Outer-membrane lipoprotein LolB n=1 Tax=Microbulbifer hydrolyticus TaxID=48074 RepID=A0A6P1T9C8_9GAMM|nr:lipoprotein insertase outer membrane protein LolB [Microbulbifer hydrolyticus]MBB5212791.1 outer membrane lipoprotein LolB [Microbulbifer hydrolyticus]QHQ38411.1 outer membrane lipoprotein LolB [Microbulbifer hydrolyticus]